MTSKRWLRMFGIRTAKIVFALSLLISCLTFGQSNAPGKQLDALKDHTPEEQYQMLQYWNSKGELDPDIASEVNSIQKRLDAWNNGSHPRKVPKDYLLNRMRYITGMLALMEQTHAPASSGDSVSLAKEIK